MSLNKTRILITIDTEFSIGGYFKDMKNKPVPSNKHVYCKIGGKDYGINLIMDILDKYELKGVFFVETESRFYFGENEVLGIINNIINRGHEVQLHIHPNFRSFINGQRRPDDLRKYSLEEQSNIIREALKFLLSCRINKILAYRSGGFYSDLNTIKALQNNGIQYSSNYNLAYRNCNYIKSNQPKYDIFCIEEVFEIPITCYKEFRIRREWNSFQISAASYKEIKEAMYHYYNQQVNIITFIIHSFEFIKPYDIQFSRITPQHFLIKRFDKICKHLANNPDKYEVITFKDLDNLVKNMKINIREKKVDFYKSSAVKTLNRYIENYTFSKFNM